MQIAVLVETDERSYGRQDEALWRTPDRLVPANADPLPMFKRSAPPPTQLSQEQRRFAEEHEATPGMHAGERSQLVYFYRHERSSTHRWLVDSHGEIVDFVSLH